ncbi:hypothetical protein Tco_0247561 [Tanacetum coccineum]
MSAFKKLSSHHLNDRLRGKDGYNSCNEASVWLRVLNSHEYMELLVKLLSCYREGSRRDDFNSDIRVLRDLNFPLLQELSHKNDASTWDIMDLLRLDDTVAETLGRENGKELIVTSPLFERRARVCTIDDPLSSEAFDEPSARYEESRVSLRFRGRLRWPGRYSMMLSRGSLYVYGGTSRR